MKVQMLPFLALIWGVFLTLWPNPSEKNSKDTNPKHEGIGEGLYKATVTSANFGLLGVNFFETENGKKRWHIESEFAELHRKQNYATFKNVYARFFANHTGNIVYTKSDIARSWTDKDLVELEGNVSIQSEKGYLFTMNKLYFDGKKNEFITDEKVEMLGPDIKNPIMYLNGIGMHADINTEKFDLKKEVEGKKKLEDGKWLRVTSRNGEFYTHESKAIFLGSAHSVLPNTIIDSDRFDMKTGKIRDELKAKGNVILKSKDKIGKAQNAYLEVGGNEIILEGKAEINSDGSLLKGKRIRMYTDEDKIEVEEAIGRGQHETTNP